MAVLAGDYVAARSFCDMVRLDQRAGQVLTRALERLCHGQIAEIKLDGRAEIGLPDYMAVVEKKTGTLFEVACHLGALVGRLPSAMVKTMRDFGSQLGVTYQLIDDFRDFACSDEELGKEAGKDLVQGIFTLPLILGPSDDAVQLYSGSPGQMRCSPRGSGRRSTEAIS